MARGPDDAPGSRRRRRSVPNESGLRALGESPSGQRDRVANEGGLRSLGDQMQRATPRTIARAPAGRRRRSGRPKWTRSRKLLTVAVVVVALLVVAAAGTYGYLQYRFDQFTKVHITAEQQAASGQPFNMLVIGSDTRVGLSTSQQAQDGNSAEVQGQRSDVVMVWHVVPSAHQITLLSIPRDTMVSMVGSDVASYGRFNRINASYGSGANQLVETIEDNFGIPINHVVQVDFGGFEGAVNALGGVSLDFTYPAKDAYSGLNVTTPGCQLLNGAQALAVARSRHYEYLQDGYWQSDGTGDFGRIQRQDAFLRALVSSAKSKYNPLTMNAFLGSLPQGITIDDSFSLNELLALAADFHSFNPAALATYTLPTESVGYVSPWGDVLFAKQPAAQQMLVSIFGSSLTSPTSPPPDTDLQSVPPPAVAPATGSGSGGTPAGVTADQNKPPPFDPTLCP